MSKNRQFIYAEIEQERVAQDREWGGAEHDDTHDRVDWGSFIGRHLGRALDAPIEAATFRRQMVRVAALATAAIEWFDRRSQEPTV